MDAPTQHRTLIVANLTASTPFLLQEVIAAGGRAPHEVLATRPGRRPGQGG